MIESLDNRRNKAFNIPPEYCVERPPFPKKAKIEITSKCDLKCYFCNHTYYKGATGEINRDFLFRILEELKSLDVEEVGLFWMGEPLLVESLPEYVAFAKKIGIKYVFITTNGRLATPDKMEKLIDSGLDSIKFSINAGSRESYIKICGVDGFDQVISNLKYAWQYRGERKKPSIYASSSFDPTNKGEYEKIHFIIKPYVDQHYPLTLYGKRKIVSVNGELCIVNTPTEEMRKVESMLPCWPLFTEPHITYNGYMGICNCDLDEKFHISDLNKMSLIEAWHSEKYVALRKQHILKDVKGTVCENCIAFR